MVVGDSITHPPPASGGILTPGHTPKAPRERRAVLQAEVLTAETRRLGSQGFGAKLQLELIVSGCESDDVTKLVEPDFIHDGAIDVDFHVAPHIGDRDQSSIDCHLPGRNG